MAQREEQRFIHKRNPHSMNRSQSGQNRLYHNFGVRDLRELLNRRRSERGQYVESNAPPPDPSYNYLKDPMRDDEFDIQQEQSTQQDSGRKPYRQGVSKGNRSHETKSSQQPHKNDQDIENPLNIKVEFSTSTGEHSYKLDKETILPTIKHVPDQTEPRLFRGRGRGGRQRGRGGRQRSYYTRTIRNNSSNKNREGTSVDFKTDIETAAEDGEVEELWDLETHEDISSIEQERQSNINLDKETIEKESVEVSLEETIENLTLDDSKSLKNSDEKVPDNLTKDEI